MTDTTDPAELLSGHQPALTGLELPEYHGRKASKMKTALTGAGSRITSPHSIGDRVVLVIEARVKSAGHEDTDDGLEYVEKLKVLDLFELAGDPGRRLLSTVRSLHRTGEDQLKGRTPIPDLGEVGYADGSGVVLTPADLAELRGDPVRAMVSPALTPCVVVYSDGARELWPDEFDKDFPRPTIGQEFGAGDSVVVVVKLIDNATGEELAAAPTAAEERDAAAYFGATPAEPDATGYCTCRAVNLLGAASVEVGGMIHVADRPCYADATLADLAGKGFRVADAPELPPPADSFSGDLGDNVPGWDDPDPATAARIAAADGAPAAEQVDPEAEARRARANGVVDRDIDGLRIRLAELTDIDEVRAALAAEENGRGRKLKPRKGALDLIRRRITDLEDAAHIAARAAQMEGGR